MPSQFCHILFINDALIPWAGCQLISHCFLPISDSLVTPKSHTIHPSSPYQSEHKMASDNNNKNNTSFLASLRETFAPNDQRRLSQSSSTQKRPSVVENVMSNRRPSEVSTTSSESYRDATSAGSQFLEDLTPGRQGRRRSSTLDALGRAFGGTTGIRRDSSGSTGESEHK